MRFNILGPLEVLDSDDRPLTISGLKERTLLAVLLVNRGEVVSVDRLMEALWRSDPPSKPLNALQARVSTLRRLLGEGGVIVTRSPGYRLEASPDDIDTHQFETLLRDARKEASSGDADGAVRIYDKALGVWRGPALDEFGYEDFARQEASRLEELRATALEERIEALLEAGRHREAVAELEGLVGAHPLREGFWRQFMTALYRSGRQAEALRAFGEARRILGEELGIEPSEELRKLEESILMQDTTLDGPGSAVEQPRHNLPVRLTSLVGRTSDIERIAALVKEHRALTLVGPGGVGKTSLGLACASELASVFGDGVWLADLSALEDHSQVPVELARSLDLDTGDRSTLEATADHLRGKDTLVIFDNCEHLLTGVAETATAILQHAPNV
ncbi:MAG TPA: BTAD domain-containing putative transcriptional regulator, partial [Acidimicrobiia bacterium]|nr:BTAD domain-containing putative transcriptional regulator [Acidimicrobiia bacterium]